MKINVENLAGTIEEFDMDDTTTIEILKGQIGLKDMVKGPIKDMRLFIMDNTTRTILDDKKNLSELGIVDNATIYVVMRQPFKDTITIGKRERPHDRITESNLGEPNGLCVSPDGNELFVVDKLLNCVKVYNTSNGQYLRSYDGNRKNDDRYIPNISFRAPQGICISSDGLELFVADTGNSCIIVLDSKKGDVIDTIPLKYRPTDISIASNNCLFVTDTANYIHVYKPSQSGGKYSKKRGTRHTRHTRRKR